MIAIRTVSETDDVRVIEGIGIPFGGPFPGNSDSYATRATPQTNFYWDLFPDRRPDDPPDVAARFTRPVTFSHGFDKTIGLCRIGGWSPVRVDKKGVWVQAQLDKRNEYYSQIADLLDQPQAPALGFSSASIEHNASVARNGDWKDWPVWDLALTPIESNPAAAITARKAAVSGTRWDVAADHVATATGLLPGLAYLMGEEIGEAHVALLKTAFDAISAFIADESNEIGKPEGDEAAQTFVTAFSQARREGKRNSGADLSLIDEIHDRCVALGCTAHSAQVPTPPTDEGAPGAEPTRSAAAPADARANARAVRKALRSGARVAL